MRGTGEHLKILRKNCGLTIAEAADLALTPRRTWEAWEQRPGTARSASPPGIAFAFLLHLRQLQVHQEIDEGGFDPADLESFYEYVDEYRRMFLEGDIRGD